MEKTSQLESYLRSIPSVDWRSLPVCLEQLDEMFDRLLHSRSKFNELIQSALICSNRSKLHESDEIRTRFVLYDHPEGNFRLRLHFWKQTGPRIIHSHRFAYGARILKGGYRHTVYTCPDDLSSEDLALEPQRTFEVDTIPHSFQDNLGDIEAIYSHRLSKGQSYIQTANPKVLSSTVLEGQTISLFVRGPAMQDQAFQWDPDNRTVIWKQGEKNLSATERKKLKLPIGNANKYLRRLDSVDAFETD